MAHDFEKKWRSQDVRLKENVDFSALLLSDRVLNGLEKAGFKKPSPIQLEAIPVAKIGKDVIVQAKSGTGKTLIFVITALQTLRRKLFRPQVLILTPTREIAAQICSVVKSVSSAFPKLTCCSFIGGLSVSGDRDKALTCQIVVGTPGRLKHLIAEKALPVNSVRLLVLDEADQLLQMSFKQEIEDIFKALPVDKQVIATSATYPAIYKNVLLKYMREPYLACLNSTDLALLGIVHYARVVKGSPMPLLSYRTKLSVLEEILKTVSFSQCLVFCNSIPKVEVLYKDIKRWGFSAAFISSAKEQGDRLKAVDRLKGFKCKVLVSSDVAARGIDAENVDFVINFDLPFNTETYMHRVGRAGRYGSVGVAISIIEEKEVLYLSNMENTASFKTLKLPDQITKDLIKKARFEEGEFVIKSEDVESLKMLRKQQRMKTKNSVNEEEEEFDNVSANKDLENSSDTNCTITKPLQAKDICLGKNDVTDTAENENVEADIVPVIDCNGCDDVSSKLIATKPTLFEKKAVIEESEKKNYEIEQLDEYNNINNCILKEPLEKELGSTVENNTVESRMENLQREHLSEYGLGVGDNVLCQEKTTEENSNDLLVRSACEIINSENKSFTEETLRENNENFNSDEVMSKVSKPGVEITNAECDHSNSEVLVSEINAEVDSELLNELKISDDLKIKDETRLLVDLPESGPQIFANKEETYVQNDERDNNVQKVGLCDILDKKKINDIAKRFTDQYECYAKKEPFIPGGKSCDSFQKVSSSAITLSTINVLNYNKSEYFYNVFKKFQEGELQTVENKAKQNDTSSSLQNLTFQHVASLKENAQEGQVKNSAAVDLLDTVVNSEICSQSYVSNGVLDYSSEQNVSTEKNSESIQKFFCNPKCESTPQHRIESEKIPNQIQISSNSDQNLPKQDELITLSEEISDESDSDDIDTGDLEGSEIFSCLENSKELDSDSSSDSCSSEESSSDSCSDSSSSEDLTSESHCHRKKHFAKKPYSSSASNSSEDRTSQNHCQFKNHSTRKHYSSSVSNFSGSARDYENYSRYNKKHYNIKRNHRYCQQSYHCSFDKKNQSHCVQCTACYQNQQSAGLRQGNVACHRSCFLPSVHKSHCHETVAYSQWYKTFYNQWHHIQSCINMHLPK